MRVRIDLKIINNWTMTDVFATVAGLMGEELPEWAGEDSINQLPVFLGESTYSPRTNMITQSNIGPMAFRNNGWKLIVDSTGSGGPKTPGAQPTVITAPWQAIPSKVGQLYNIERDPYEEHDLWGKHPEVVEELRLKFKDQIWKGRSR